MLPSSGRAGNHRRELVSLAAEHGVLCNSEHVLKSMNTTTPSPIYTLALHGAPPDTSERRRKPSVVIRKGPPRRQGHAFPPYLRQQRL